MGYRITQIDSKIRILASKKAEALAAMKAMDPSREGRGRWDGQRQWSWVDQKHIVAAQTLEEALAEWGYESDIDNEGNITDLQFTSEKLGQETVMFDRIACFVEDDSFIEMKGEDGALWRWVFKAGKVKEVTPSIKWPE